MGKSNSARLRPSHRPLMVASTIQSVIAQSILSNEVNIRGLKSNLICISSVNVSVDLRYADIEVSILAEPPESAQHFKVLLEHTSAFQKLLSRKLPHLRFQPEVRFNLMTEDRVASAYMSL